MTERVSTINKVYYYYDGPNARAIDLAFPLKQIAAGNRVFVGTYEPIKALADEMREDKDKHADEDINAIIFELVALMEKNLSEI